MSEFSFKHFKVIQAKSAMKVGTDSMILGALLKTENKRKALDVGAGTGVLSLMAAQKNQDAVIHAVEIDALAADECRSNFHQSAWKDRLIVTNLDYADLSTDEKFDLIFSNPPYFLDALQNETENKALARHSVSLNPKSFFEKSIQLLSETGEIQIIIPCDDKVDWILSARRNELHLNQDFTLFGKRDGKAVRSVLLFSFHDKPLQKFEMYIREQDGNYSKEYIELTKEFHSKDLNKS